MKRAGAIAWLALTGLAALFLVTVWLFSSSVRHHYPFHQLAKALTSDIAIMAPAIRYLRNHPRKAITVPPRIKYLYPCQYPGCQARYDEELDGTTDDQSRTLSGWVYPQDAEVEEDTPTHGHIINVLHRVEVEA